MIPASPRNGSKLPKIHINTTVLLSYSDSSSKVCQPLDYINICRVKSGQTLMKLQQCETSCRSCTGAQVLRVC